MPSVAARILSVETDPFPGWSRVELELADDSRAEVYDKQPVLGIGEQQRPGAVIRLACAVVEQAPESVTIRLQHGVETTDGRAVLHVRPSQITK